MKIVDEVQKIGSGGENESFPLNERLMVYKYIIEKEGTITIEENGEINIKDKDNKITNLSTQDAIKTDYRELDNARNSNWAQTQTFLKEKIPALIPAAIGAGGLKK